jgi:hypothetical protein
MREQGKDRIREKGVREEGRREQGNKEKREQGKEEIEDTTLLHKKFCNGFSK